MSVLADRAPLRQKDFRRLWTSNIVTVIGGQLAVVAVPQQIYELTRSLAYVGLTGLFALVPLVIAGLWGGSLADVMDRRKLLIITSSGLTATAVLFWVQAALDWRNVWFVLVLLAVQSGFFGVNQPTRSATIPRLIPLEQLPAANALNMTVMQFGAIAGPLLAGVLIPVLGLSWLYLFDAIALLATLWAVWMLPAIPPMGERRRAGLAHVLDGFRYLGGQKVLLASFVVDIIAMVFGMTRVLFPQIAHETFDDPVTGGYVLGLLFAAMSVGAVLGGVFSGWLPRIHRQGVAVIVMIVGWGVGVLAFGLFVLAAGQTGHRWLLWPALLSLALAGAADMISAAFRSTMLQQVATDEVRGRLQGVFTVVVAGGPRIGDLTHGWAAASVAAGTVAAGGGALVVIGVLIAAVAFPAFLRYRV